MQQGWLLENGDLAQAPMRLSNDGGPASPKCWQPIGSVETVKVRV
jgi:hypothetical protein